MELLYHISDMSIMGFVEVVKHLPFLLKVKQRLEQWIEDYQPDAVILIDYPGFNLRFARTVAVHDIPIYYYISPQVWAWGKRRIKKMKKLLRKIFVIFPFEEELFQDNQIPVEFVGHPLTEEIKTVQSRRDFFAEHDNDPDIPTIGLLPGSRKQEIERHLDVMLQAADILKAQWEGPLQFWLALAPDISLGDIGEYALPEDVKIIQGKTHEIMNYSQAVMVIIYKMNTFTWWIGKMLVDMDHIGLANIVAGRKVVPELLQKDANGPRIAREVLCYLQDTDYYDEVKEGLSDVKELLGEPGAGRRVAHSISSELYGIEEAS